MVNMFNKNVQNTEFHYRSGIYKIKSNRNFIPNNAITEIRY